MKTAVVLLSGFLAQSAFASTSCREIDPALDEDGTSCAAQELAHADAKLNKIYRELLAKLDFESKHNSGALNAKGRLIDAQRAWVQLRDLDCEAVFDYLVDGTVRVGAQMSCQLQHTEERTQQLTQLLDGS